MGRRIGSDQLPPGTIVDPDAVGREFEVSRTVVREAFQVLVSKGMLEPRPRVGTKVARRDQWDLLDHDVIVWQLDADRLPEHFDDMLSLGACVEPLAAQRAASSDDHELIGAELLAICELFAARVEAGDFEGFCALDVEFHSLVIRGTRSPVFQRLAGITTAMLLARNRLGLMPEIMNRCTVDGHRLVAQAIADGDIEGAATLMKRVVEPQAAPDGAPGSPCVAPALT